MKSFIKIFILLFLTICVSCKGQESQKRLFENVINDSLYTLFPKYKSGDSRRYGIFPDSLNNKIHPNTGKSLINSVIELAQNNPVEIKFHKGYYGINLIFDSKQNIDLYFNKSEFDLVHITNEGGTHSKNINLKGTLILYDRFGTYYSSNINVDSLIIKTDLQKNLKNSRSRGCHIYKGTDSLYIKYLKIEDLGSGDKKYINNHAALAIDGLRENPSHITIDEVYITSSDRHGAYITGSNNVFKKIIINKYGQGTTDFMSGMQDSKKGDEKILSALWINRCNNCLFENVQILTKYSKNGFPLKLDEGDSGKPTIIENLFLDVEYKDSLILDDILTNVLVKRLKTIE